MMTTTPEGRESSMECLMGLLKQIRYELAQAGRGEKWLLCSLAGRCRLPSAAYRA